MPIKRLHRKRHYADATAQLAYGALEPRRMLVSDVSEIVFAADFEDVDVASGAFEHVESVSGFTATSAPCLLYTSPSPRD